ncbi:hypothetical protein J7T55_011745 [Diaporthe amygdali]|uniref:uncharacterized protein n=1 Tax=Phomopsis amygdali TaxID=1214568 RepID=UPI0022FDD354|nr:uncharacterized protein J7T55_011745 [Diaporthe amygdali]KAJ0123280.1 hypothetical protein J7T55_011745 [Diaporthe amygdali]
MSSGHSNFKVDKAVIQDAEERVRGEYLSMLSIFNTVPSFVPQPRGHGKCLESDGFFFFCDYKEIDHRAPDPTRLGERLSELHLKSRGKSPNGKFGSDHVPYDGKLPLLGEWDESWLSFFTKLMRLSYNHDIHLWEENIGTDINTNELYIIDAAAYYAHNEKEIGIWRCDHHQMKSKEYIKQYLKHFEPDEPTEEFEDRNLLYSVQTKFMNCGHMPGTIVRAQLMGDLKYLIGKYLEGDGK